MLSLRCWHLSGHTRKMAEKSLVYFCSFCGLILFSSCRVSATELTSDMVRRWAKRIGSEAAEFTENVTGAKYLKQAYENLTLTPEEVHDEVLNKMREEMKVFFSSKTSSLKVWRQKSWCGRYRLGKIHLKLNPAYNVYNPVNWQHFHLNLISGNHTSCRERWLTRLVAISLFLCDSCHLLVP